MESGFGESKESYRINKTKILDNFRNLIIERTESELLETRMISKKCQNDVKDPDKAAKLVNKMDRMINIKKNDASTIARKPSEIFKRFETDNKFISAVNISKATINFKLE